MRISVIVPAYNSAGPLGLTLRYLASQSAPAGGDFDFEVIVVDDGSTDGTAELVRGLAGSLPDLSFVHIPRDADSCRARARNRGIARASGEVLTFLDTGVLVPPDFLGLVARRYGAPGAPESRDRVLVHTLLGLTAREDDEGTQILTGATPATLRSACQRLTRLPTWLDMRARLFDEVEDQLDRLPAPWSLGWTGALTVPAACVRRVGGFDEGFRGWGSEDTDLCYRLFRGGASFVAEREAIAVHIPHQTAEDDQARDRSNLANRRRLHRKAYTFETELYYLLPGGLSYTQALWRFDRLILADVLPGYAADFLRAVEALRRPPALLVGFDEPVAASYLRASHVLVHSRGAARRVTAGLPESVITHQLGCDTPFADASFGSAVVSEFYRLLPARIRQDLVVELARVAEQVLLLFSPWFVSPVSKAGEMPWASAEEIEHQLAAAGLTARRRSFGRYDLFEVRRTASAPPLDDGADSADGPGVSGARE
jgi:glycosyltransferase involved in cell wall biosynthesis